MTVHDCFLFFNELDALELRLEELDPVVDRFVLVEATTTFSGRPKPLVFQENRDRFARFASKLTHVVVDELEGKDAWTREARQRDAMLRGLAGATPDDVVLISDVDEIPRAGAVRHFVESGVEAAAFELRFYYYRLNCQNVRGTPRNTWNVALRRRALTSPQATRVDKHGYPTLPDAGWHFSCLGDPGSIRTKIEAFSHQELNLPRFTDEAEIQRRMRAGADLFDRPGFEWRYVPLDGSFPRHVLSNPERFAHLIEPVATPPPAPQVRYDHDYMVRNNYCVNSPEHARIARAQAHVIARVLGTRRALVAGCAAGEILRPLLALGVDAWGFDGAHELDQFVYPDVRERVLGFDVAQVGAFPFERAGGAFDTLVAIDLFEHVEEERVDAMLDGVSEHFERLALVISSNPAFPGHVCVKPFSWWRARLEARGFELLAEPSILTPEERESYGVRHFDGAHEDMSEQLVFFRRRRAVVEVPAVSQEPEVSRLLLVHHRNPTTTAAYLERALRRRVQVTTAGEGQDVPLTRSQVDLGELLGRLGGSFDAVLEVQGDGVDVVGQSEVDVPCAWWAIDSHLAMSYGHHFFRASAFDHVFVAQKHHVERYRDWAWTDASWLPLAADPEVHRPFDRTLVHDVGFVGNVVAGLHDARRHLLARILARFERVAITRGLFLEDASRFVAGCRLAFNRSLHEDVNMRVFELAACGRPVLTDRLPAKCGLGELFEEGELLLYDDPTLEETIERWLADPAGAEAVAAAGRARVLAQHTYDHRAAEIVRVLGLRERAPSVVARAAVA